MNKIYEISPIGANPKKYKFVKDLETDFLKTLQKYAQPKVLLEDFRKSGTSRKVTVTLAAESDVLDYLHQNFERIITSVPAVLKSVIDHFESQKWDALLYDDTHKKSTLFGKELIHIFGYDERFRSTQSRGIWFSKQLNVKACPYCNAQYTILTDKTFGRELAKFQFDHFYPKSKYPYLSVSMYNLMPSCANCNVTKSAKDLNYIEHFHPFVSNFADFAKFTLRFNPDPSKLTINSVKTQNLEIDFVPIFDDPDDIVKKHDELYHIKAIYNRHTDIAKELLMTAIVYNKALVSGHMKIKKLFASRNEYFRFLLRNYAEQKDISKRPLSKFTQDIAKQLRLLP